jgi:BirA family biotin operon repressor/biotin-[acetyl-CoA-carboxylase] ligase
MTRQINQKTGLLHGDVIHANEQTGGKGHGDNSWESEPGKNLTFSIYVLPLFLQANEQFYLNMLISLGVHDFVSALVAQNRVTLKWPNDIYIEEKKVGGILISHSISGLEILYSIVGVGLNMNQFEFLSDAPNPASIMHYLGKEVDLDDGLKQLLKCIENRYIQIENKNKDLITRDYLNAMLGYNEWRYFMYNSKKTKAMITGVSSYGMLQLVDKDRQGFECGFKEIEFTF